MKLGTRVFEFCNGRYASLPELAKAMGIAVSQVYRVRQGKRHINEKFITGAIKAFPGYKLDDLFYLALDEGARRIVKGKPMLQKPALGSKVILTTSDVAQVLGLHPNTVRRWNKKGILKSYRISPRGDRRFRWGDVDGFVKEQEIE